MIAKLSGSVFGPKFMSPKHSRLTFRPVRPSFHFRLSRADATLGTQVARYVTDTLMQRLSRPR